MWCAAFQLKVQRLEAAADNITGEANPQHKQMRWAGAALAKCSYLEQRLGPLDRIWRQRLSELAVDVHRSSRGPGGKADSSINGGQQGSDWHSRIRRRHIHRPASVPSKNLDLIDGLIGTRVAHLRGPVCRDE